MDEMRPILVVDDDPDIRQALADCLENEGYSVDTAVDGEAALAKLKAGLDPQLILTDLMMPILDGAGFRAAQKADPSLTHIPVILMTASGRPSELAHRFDFDGFLPKPLSADKLLGAVASLLAIERDRTGALLAVAPVRLRHVA